MSGLAIFDDPATLEALRGMSELEIRRAQAIAQAQIPLAFEQRNADALAWLDRAGETYAAELLRRLEVAA